MYVMRFWYLYHVHCLYLEHELDWLWPCYDNFFWCSTWKFISHTVASLSSLPLQVSCCPTGHDHSGISFIFGAVFIGKESFLLGWYRRKSSYPFHWFISSVGIPLSSSHIRPFALLFRLSLHNKDTPQLTLASGVKRSGWQAANEQ